MAARKHITLRTKLASALLALGDVPYTDAKIISEDQLISLYQFDHGILHAIEPVDDYWNLTPRLITPHRKKSARDKAITSKVVRIDTGIAEHQRRLLTKDRGDTAPKSKWPTRKLQSKNTLQRSSRR